MYVVIGTEDLETYSQEEHDFPDPDEAQTLMEDYPYLDQERVGTQAAANSERGRGPRPSVPAARVGELGVGTDQQADELSQEEHFEPVEQDRAFDVVTNLEAAHQRISTSENGDEAAMNYLRALTATVLLDTGAATFKFGPSSASLPARCLRPLSNLKWGLHLAHAGLDGPEWAAVSKQYDPTL